MDENHQDKVASKTVVSGDIKWVHSKRSELWVPKHSKPTGFENRTRWDKLQFFAQVIGAFAIPLSIIALIISDLAPNL